MRVAVQRLDVVTRFGKEGTEPRGGNPQQIGLRVAGFPKAWDITRGASRIIVAFPFRSFGVPATRAATSEAVTIFVSVIEGAG